MAAVSSGVLGGASVLLPHLGAAEASRTSGAAARCPCADRPREQLGEPRLAEIRDAWGELIGERDMAALEAGLRRLRAALWPPG